MNAKLGRPEVSVVVPSYNTKGTISRCLESLLAQDAGEPFEVIVVDSSTDGTDSLIRSRFPSVSLLSMKTKVLPGAARNLGIKKARGDVVAFVDADCVADRSWLAELMNAYRSNGCDAVAGSVANANPENLVGWGSYAIEFSRYHPKSPARELDSSASCNLSVRRHVFESIGCFQEAMFGSEDIMFTLAMTRSGLRLVFSPSARVSHINRGGIRAYLSHQYLLGRCTGAARILLNMPGAWALKTILPLPAFVALRLARITSQLARWERLSPPRLTGAVCLAAIGLMAFSLGECAAATRHRLSRGHDTMEIEMRGLR